MPLACRPRGAPGNKHPPPRPARRDATIRLREHCGPWQSRGYSAHIGREVEIHYRWHALYGRTVRRFYGEKRSGADVVVVEGEPGAAIVVAAWMLDPAVCAAMAIGAAHVSAEALVDLHLLLMEQGLRRSFPDDADVVQEAHNEECVPADSKIQGATAAQHGVGFDGVEGDRRRRTQRGHCAPGSSPDGSGRRGEQGERR
jgi:hypothetical protein